MTRTVLTDSSSRQTVQFTRTWWIVPLAGFGWFSSSFVPTDFPAGASIATIALAILWGPIVMVQAVLAHELGHAMVGRLLGGRPDKIELTGWGGSTRFAAAFTSPWRDFWTALAGPSVNVLLAGCVAVTPTPTAGIWPGVRSFVIAANLALAVLNLLPGNPFDGGHLVRSFVTGITGRADRGVLCSGIVGLVSALALLIVTLASHDESDLAGAHVPHFFGYLLAAWLGGAGLRAVAVAGAMREADAATVAAPRERPRPSP